MERSEDIRAVLAEEIERRERELKELRATLADLDKAMAAALAAHQAATKARDVSMAEKAREATRREREVTGEHRKAVADKKKEATPTISQSTASQATVSKATAPETSTPLPQPVSERAQSSGAVALASQKDDKTRPERSIPAAPAHVQWPDHGRYATMKVWKAIQNIITENRAPMPMEDIVRELEKGGAHLGDTPMRTVAAAVGYMKDKIFYVGRSNGRTVVSVLRPSDF